LKDLKIEGEHLGRGQGPVGRGWGPVGEGMNIIKVYYITSIKINPFVYIKLICIN
jgi:hypothetical protein